MADASPVRLPARVTFETAPQALEAAAGAVAAGVRQFDLSGCTEFDSSLLALLLELSRRAGAPVRVLGVPPNLRKLAALYGVDEILFERD